MIGWSSLLFFFQFLFPFANSPYSLAHFCSNRSLVPRLIWMAQALEKVNTSPNLWKMFSFAQKMVILFQNSVFGEIQFSQKSLINRKSNPLPLHDKSLGNKNIPLLLQGPAQWRYRKKKQKFWRRGRAATGAHLSKMKASYQTFQTRYSSLLWYA